MSLVRQLKSIIVLLALFALVLLVWQNPRAIALVFLNTTLPLQLPIALWILLFGFAGMITSLSWQLLQSLFLSKNTRVSANYPRESRPSEPSVRNSTYSIPKDSPRNPVNLQQESDWDFIQGDDWYSSDNASANVNNPNLDDEIARERELRFAQAQEQAEAENREVIPQKPATPNRKQPQQSPGERERLSRKMPAESAPPQKTTRVYDANYRVITPPYQSDPNQSSPDNFSDDEDWI